MSMLAAASWPTAILLAAWWARPVFSKIGDAITPIIRERDWRLKVGNLEASVAAQAQQAAIDVPSDDSHGPSETVAALPANQSPGEHEPPILSERPLVNNFIKEAQTRLDELDELKRLGTAIRWYADMRATAAHEWTLNRIFGSQIRLLETANRTSGRLTMDQVKHHYDMAVTASPSAFAQDGMWKWLQFLQNAALITTDPGGISITDAGRDFLIYLVNTGQSSFGRPL